MSGKPTWLVAAGVCATGLLLIIIVWPLDAWAFDPLLTVPDVIETGKTLPGDAMAVQCPAQKDFSIPLALGEAVDLGLCYNPQIKEAWANIKIQAGAVGEARAAYLPTLNGSVGNIYDRTRYPGSGVPGSTVNSWTANGALNWRILDFGGRGANR